MAQKQLFKTSIDVKVDKFIKSIKSIDKSLASYLTDTQVSEVGSTYVEDLRGLIKKQPDLLYAMSILVSEGVNKNKDAFLRSILARIYDTPRHKFVDYEHDAEGDNLKKENPKKYQIVGHIYDSQLCVQRTGEKVPDHDVTLDQDGKYFGANSIWRDEPLDIVVAWVIYQFQYPALAAEIIRLTEESPDKFGVSMEVLFSDYKFRIGGVVNSEEDFNFDGNTTGATEVRKGHPLADKLQEMWPRGEGRMWNGLPVVRILGGDIFFSGMAVTKNRANTRSWNTSIASEISTSIEEEKIGDNKDLVALIEAVAKKSNNFDIAQCEIVDGKPSCDCLAIAVSSQIDDILKNIDELTNALAKTKKDSSKADLTECPFCNSEDVDDNHIVGHLGTMQNGLIAAQRKLKNLYENTIDEDLSAQEVLEFVEEIEVLLQRGTPSEDD